MIWLNSPKCVNCNKETKYAGSIEPEEQDVIMRIEYYQCECGEKCEFNRYVNPAKIAESKTGRCSEYSNLFGAILKSLYYDVRILDNFEDHKWNEYYSDFQMRVHNFILNVVDTFRLL